MAPDIARRGEPAAATPHRGGWLPVRPPERLRDAADRLFTAQGIRAVSIDALASAANVPKSGFYRHFTSKDDLVLDYLTRASTRFRESLVTIEAGHSAAAARLTALLDTAPDNAIMLNAIAEYRGSHPDMTLLLSRHRQWIRQWIHNQVVDHAPDEASFVALELAAIFDAFTLEAGDGVEAEQVRRVFDAVVDRTVGRGEP
ncbi:TetR/AcrR family transcriptional regulator [Microbacterium oleivorans]|uniref:TetR/AcrR family transcriptional regulator n=1 Tax=Microbacterium TaxID=33882 RepID=UPI00203C27BC|nr:TetR/AcrR family transcriptional regulator [Microbacterium oleivorans]MCM3696920.1 TetR/AcrR family transcriptional regulator [Microbacterium oleivorans]